MKRFVLFVLGPTLVALAVVAGLLYLGDRAWNALRPEPRYHLPFAEIDCVPPPGLSRADFLTEVQYLEELPAELPLLDAGLAERLAHAFAAHPWVEKVERVRITPPRSVHVELRYRVPVLSVASAERRAVDRLGVLLPRTGREKDLPVLIGPVSPPEAGPGNLWGDADVEAAAATLALLREDLATLGLDGSAVEIHAGEVLLRKGEVRVLWGHPPGKEAEDEPGPPEKLQRLRTHPPGEGTLDLRRPE